MCSDELSAEPFCSLLGKLHDHYMLSTTENMNVFARIKTVVALVFLLSTSAYAAETLLKIDTAGLGGPSIFSISDGYKPRPLRVTGIVNGRPTPLARSVVNSVGGVIFLEEAQPADELAKVCPEFRYDQDAPYGKRVRARYSNLDAYLVMADWEIKPIIRFVASGDHALWSQMRPGEQPEIRVEIDVHESVEDTLVGFLIFLADNPGKFTPQNIAFTFRNYEIPGFNRTLSNDPLKSNELPPGSKFNSTYSISSLASYGMTQLMFTDWRQDYNYTLSDNKIAINGTPYYLFVNRTSGDSGPATEFDDTLRDPEHPIYQANPMLFEAVSRISRNISYFRSIASLCPSQWKRFYDEIKDSTSVEHLLIETPAAIGY